MSPLQINRLSCVCVEVTGQSTGIKADVVVCGCSSLTRDGDMFVGLGDRVKRFTPSSVEGLLSLAFKF